MNNASVAEQKEIFEASLEGADLEALNALVARHKTNAALTQQLALDASRLVTTTQERLAQQAGAGFFKRFTSAISGKTSENQAQNQIDMPAYINTKTATCSWPHATRSRAFGLPRKKPS